MKGIILYTAFILLAIASAMPTDDQAGNANQRGHLEYEPLHIGERSGRHARATCDLLSISTPWGSLNDSACAAHCLTMNKGFRGGHCKEGVCHCRK